MVLTFDLSSNKQYYICTGLNAQAENIPTTIVIPSHYNNLPVKSIKQEAFYKNKTIIKVIISNGIESIGNKAFAEMTKLSTIILPYSLRNIGDEAFADCTHLAEINFLSRGLFSCKKNNGIFANAGALNDTGCKLKCGYFVEKIPDRLFCPYEGEETPNLQAVIFEKTEEDQIDGCMLDSCANIGIDAFKGCVDLMSIELPSKLTTISQGAFDQCYRLVEVLNYSKFFKDSNGTEEFEKKFPYGLRRVSFNGTILPSNIVQDNDSIVRKASSTWITIPCFVLDDKIINMGRLNTPFEKIIQIKKDVEYDINNYAFYKKNLNQVYIGQCQKDGYYIYGLPEISPPTGAGGAGSTKIIKSAIFSKIQEIGDYAFFGNQNLHYCLVGNELSRLGAFAFSRTGLKKILNGHAKAWKFQWNYFTSQDEWQEITLPLYSPSTNLVHISGDYCGEKFIHSESLIYGNKNENKTFTTNGDVYLCPYVFKEVYKGNKTSVITSFDFSQDNAIFAENAFAGTNFSGLTYEGSFEIVQNFPKDSITTATINTDITKQLEQSQITSLTMENTTIANECLTCASIETMQINNLGTDNTLSSLFSSGTSSLAHLTELNLVGVTKLGALGLQGASNLMTLRIPDIKEIGTNAFLGIKKIANLYLPSLKNWCTVTLSSKTSSPFSAATTDTAQSFKVYFNNALTTNLFIPGTVTSIAKYAFYGWKGQSLQLPVNISIGDYSFSNTSLTTVTVKGNTHISSDAFAIETNQPAKISVLSIHNISNLTYFKNHAVTKLTVTGADAINDSTVFSDFSNITTLDLCYTEQIIEGTLQYLPKLETLVLKYAGGVEAHSPSDNRLVRNNNANKTMAMYDAYEGRRFGSLFEDVTGLTKAKGGYYRVSQTYKTVRDGEIFSQNIKYDFLIPTSLKKITIREGYIPYDTFGGISENIEIHFGDNVEPSRKMFGEKSIQEETCCANQTKAQGAIYIDGWLIAYDKENDSREVKILETCRGIADYACAWNSIKIYNGCYNTNGNLVDDEFSAIPLRYIGVRALAGATIVKDLLNNICMPPSLRVAKYLSCDSWYGADNLELYDNFDKIELGAFKDFKEMKDKTSGVIKFYPKNTTDPVRHLYDEETFRGDVVKQAYLPSRYDKVSTLGIDAGTYYYGG